MAKIRITVEYDLEDGRLEGETDLEVLVREKEDWLNGNVGLPDIVACDTEGDRVEFELIPSLAA